MGPSSRPLVLIVDDNDETRDALRRILAMRGLSSVEAADGFEALDYLRNGGTASAIVLDLRMPMMDGFGVRAELAANPTWARIPIIVHSAAMPEVPVSGVFASVHKGTDDPDVLLNALSACLDCSP